MTSLLARLEAIDPGAHRRVKGLRLVTAYGLAALLGMAFSTSEAEVRATPLTLLAGGIALWASVCEGSTARFESSRDLSLLVASAVLGAMFTAACTPWLAIGEQTGPEVTLAVGAFLVGFLKRWMPLGSGIGTQFFLGQLLAYGLHLTSVDFTMIAFAGVLAAVASITPRALSGPAEHPMPISALPIVVPYRLARSETVMGLQAAVAVLVIAGLNEFVALTEPAWAMAACTFVIAGSAAGTVARIRQRVVGTAIGLPLGLACLPPAEHFALAVWVAAAVAMIVYAIALPERYDIACAAYTFTLVVTLAATGEHSLWLLSARFWETLLGGAIGLSAALFLFPLREAPKS